MKKAILTKKKQQHCNLHTQWLKPKFKMRIKKGNKSKVNCSWSLSRIDNFENVFDSVAYRLVMLKIFVAQK